MTNRTAKCVGWSLIVIGLLGVAVTAVNITMVDPSPGADSPTAVAKAISGELIPATMGVLMAFVGVLFLVRAWWRGRAASSKMLSFLKLISRAAQISWRP